MSAPDAVVNLGLRAAIAVSTPGFITRQPRPLSNVPTVVPGTDPVRLLLLGAGIAVGYGVLNDGLAVPGQLAQILASGLRRGVIVDRRTDPSLTLATTVEFVGTKGAAGYAAAIYMPAFREITYSSSRRWQRDLRQLIAHLRATGGDDLRVVIGGIALPTTPVSRERIGTVRARLTNAELERCARETPGVTFVPPPSYSSLVNGRVFDRDYYRQYSASISKALLPHLRALADETDYLTDQ